MQNNDIFDKKHKYSKLIKDIVSFNLISGEDTRTLIPIVKNTDNIYSYLLNLHTISELMQDGNSYSIELDYSTLENVDISTIFSKQDIVDSTQLVIHIHYTMSAQLKDMKPDDGRYVALEDTINILEDILTIINTGLQQHYKLINEDSLYHKIKRRGLLCQIVD